MLTRLDVIQHKGNDQGCSQSQDGAIRHKRHGRAQGRAVHHDHLKLQRATQY